MTLNLLQTGLNMIRKVLPAAAGSIVQYDWGDEIIQIVAIKGRGQNQVLALGDFKIEHSDRDFIFDRMDLVHGGIVSDPERGHKIYEPETEKTWLVTPMGDEGCFAGIGQDDEFLRVHVKAVDSDE